MTHEVDLYDGYYGHLATDPQVEIRRETYGEDLGQASWITASEAESFDAVFCNDAEGFEGIQRFLDMGHILARERRLSRYMFLAEKRFI